LKCTLEFLTGDKTWRNVQVQISLSRNGNNVAKYDGKIYVWKNMKESEQVLSLVGKKWVKAGRITHGTVFIGSPYEMSYSEYLYSDEGMKESKRILDALTNRARDLNAGRLAVTLDQAFQGGVHA
jgi:hypothetical protein